VLMDDAQSRGGDGMIQANLAMEAVPSESRAMP